jgi:hypothetical protein
MIENLIKTIISENFQNPNDKFYHGTRSLLPFTEFDSRMIGTGIVSSGGRKYGGFFFTDNFNNAEYYTEYFIAEVTVDNILPTKSKNPPDLMKKAAADHKNYMSTNVLDGAAYSNVVVVPSSNINDIHIIDWIFVGDEKFYFEQLDKFFGDEENWFVNQDMINDTLNMIKYDVPNLLTIPVFKKYYNSK